MSAAAALLDQLGRPGDVRLGTAQPEPIRRLATGLSGLDRTLGGGLPRGRVVELAGRRARWSGGPERLAVLDGLDTRIVVARNRIGRPGQSLVLRQACA